MIQPALQIDGLVATPCVLTSTDLLSLPRIDFVEPLIDPPPAAPRTRRWQGYRMPDVLKLAEPLPTAHHVRIGAGAYVVPLALAQLGQALLADTLDDQPITLAQGAPWRFILPGRRRFINVKSVDHLELVAEPGENTAIPLLRARNRAQRAQAKAQANSAKD